MKNTHKLIPALAMLLISAVLMSTASFAWFSMNRDVNVTGMEIAAKSDNVWLAINGGASFDATQAETEFVSAVTGTELYPVAPVGALTKDNVAKAEAWHFAYSDSTTSSAQTSGYKTFPQEKFGNYVASETFAIGLSDVSSTDSADDLMLMSVTLPANTGISVVVVCGDNVFNVTATNTDYDQVIADTVTKTGVAVTVYYYINGEDTNVTTANIASLTGKVELVFGIEE